ncbi:MAG: hypothetical protein QOJ41_2050 [Acidobacteriaceae bacterium]|jgi:hypothetical protein|nr:hypothetical protein [Acidobacteriaceae bacterium]
MAMKLNTRNVSRYEGWPSNERDTLIMLGGVALVVIGAGIVLSNPAVWRYVERSPLKNVISNLIPDVERYFKLRAM